MYFNQKKNHKQNELLYYNHAYYRLREGAKISLSDTYICFSILELAHNLTAFVPKQYELALL